MEPLPGVAALPTLRVFDALVTVHHGASPNRFDIAVSDVVGDHVTTTSCGHGDCVALGASGRVATVGYASSATDNVYGEEAEVAHSTSVLCWLIGSVWIAIYEPTEEPLAIVDQTYEGERTMWQRLPQAASPPR